MQVPNSIGRIFMNRPWVSNTSPNNEAVYVTPNGKCFRGKLDEGATGLVIWDEVVKPDNPNNPAYRTDGSVWENFAGAWHYSNLNDSTANDRNLTMNGNPQADSNGVIGTAMEFDGTDDYLTTINYKAIGGGSARTIETWIKSNQSNSGILDWGASGNHWSFGWNAQGPFVETDHSNGKRQGNGCLLYTSPSPRDRQKSRMPSSA